MSVANINECSYFSKLVIIITAVNGGRPNIFVKKFLNSMVGVFLASFIFFKEYL